MALDDGWRQLVKQKDGTYLWNPGFGKKYSLHRTDSPLPEYATYLNTRNGLHMFYAIQEGKLVKFVSKIDDSAVWIGSTGEESKPFFNAVPAGEIGPYFGHSANGERAWVLEHLKLLKERATNKEN